MQMDNKMILLVWCLCWFELLGLEARPLIKMEMPGSNTVTVLTNLSSENVSRSDTWRRPRHYVVIGAFKELKNASKFVRRVASVGFEPKYFLNKERGLYYVYIVIYDDLASASRVSAKLREVNFIKDAWVFSTETGEPLSERLMASVEVEGRELLSDTKSAQTKSRERPSATSPAGTSDETPNVATVKGSGGTGIPQGTNGEKGTDTKVSEPKESDGPVAKNTGSPKGETEKTAFKPTPSKAINQLVQADKGDVIIFENLLFHKNSSVLRKGSRDEMRRLHDALKGRAGLRIKIHGHTNGDFKGEIYLLAENDERFFKLSGKNKVVKGDDKLLSAERAKVIKRYLGTQGIDGDRIETQGWGDRRMLYPKGHLKAPLNRRVEIEVLED